MRTAVGNGQVLGDVSCYGDIDTGFLIHHRHGIIRHRCLIDIHAIYLAEREGLAHDRQVFTVVIRHLCCLHCRELIQHIAHLYVQCLGT